MFPCCGDALLDLFAGDGELILPSARDGTLAIVETDAAAAALTGIRSGADLPTLDELEAFLADRD